MISFDDALKFPDVDGAVAAIQAARGAAVALAHAEDLGDGTRAELGAAVRLLLDQAERALDPGRPAT